MFKLLDPVSTRVRMDDDTSPHQTTFGEVALGFNGHFIKIGVAERNWDGQEKPIEESFKSALRCLYIHLFAYAGFNTRRG